MTYTPKVAVVGGGIIGVSTAAVILEKVPNIEVTLISEKFTPYTTGDGSAGLWYPYKIGNVPPENIKFWCSKTFEFLQDILTSPNAGEYGVGLLPLYKLSRNPIPKPAYDDIFLSWRPMNSKELDLFPAFYKYGTFMTTYFVECKKLLPMLMKKIKSLGGKIIKRKVNDFAELYGEYDVVINCTGLGSSHLVNDADLAPIRGQVFRVQAPWLKYGIMDEDFYILPNSDEVICGGTFQKGNWNLNVDPVDRQNILDGCAQLVPSIKNAEVIRHWVGLRPGRHEPRLERETFMTEKGPIEMIHNYGHGGSGVTVGWGCAHEVAVLLEDVLNELNLKHLTSNL